MCVCVCVREREREREREKERERQRERERDLLCHPMYEVQELVLSFPMCVPGMKFRSSFVVKVVS